MTTAAEMERAAKVAVDGDGDKAAPTRKSVAIPPLKEEKITVTIRGTTPYCQNRFSAKAMATIKETQQAGSTARSRKTREAKDFDLAFEQAKHVSHDGWIGMPASGFRAALISACRVAGFVMTRAKLSLFVEANGNDKVDATPLVRITKGTPYKVEHAVRNATGVVDLRARPMWDPGWEARISIRYDGDIFTAQDVVNLLYRVGKQVGIGEGRPDSRDSTGMGWGLFDVDFDSVELESAVLPELGLS